MRKVEQEGHRRPFFVRFLLNASGRRVEGKVHGDISPFPNLTTSTGTPVANSTLHF